ncbi:UNVERIFIED_CONTAM: hypothetical protein GTU68_030861 [Idotea baltica]|nr:hypothetical protein [Idotea baltica]
MQYPETTAVMSGVMFSLLAGCRSLLAPLVATFISKFGNRKTTTIGTIFCFTGLISSTFCTSVYQLSITLGAMMGIGICIIESGQVVVIANYFDKKLSIANGVRVSGNPLGGICFPFVLVYFLQNFGARSTNIMLAAVFLNIFVCAALIRPLETHKKIQVIDSLKRNEKEFHTNKSDNRNIYKQLMKSKPEELNPKKRALEFHFLKMGVYWVFIFMIICVAMALPLVIFYIPIYGNSIGLTPTQNSFLLSLQSSVDILFRMTMGFLSNKKIFKIAHGFIFRQVYFCTYEMQRSFSI